MYSYKEVETVIANTKMTVLLKNGVEISYNLMPVDSYKLHAKELDQFCFDEVSMTETGEIIPGFTKGIKSCPMNYDFKENPREFYTVPSQEEKNDEKLV